jgi:phosphate transport system permease protein
MRSSDRYVERALQLLAFSSLAALVAITFFIFKEGAPFIFRVGLDNFLSGEWHPTAHRYGVAYMIAGSAAVTGGALLLGVPLGIACAIVLGEMCGVRLRSFLKPLVEILAAIPSVVFGFIGIAVLLPWIREHLGGPGASALAGALVLGVMILPTIIAISLDALRAVPRAYRDASLAIGATEWQTIWHVVLPAARSGMVAAVILGVGRAVGETMAVVMVTGNAVQLPHSALAPLRTLTANLALEMAYSTGEHRAALFATGVVLFLVIVVLNTLAGLARRDSTVPTPRRSARAERPPVARRQAETATPQ